MAEDNKIFSWIDSKVVYSLSFLLIIFTLRDSILALFPSGISFQFLWFNISPERFLDAIFLIQFLSIYFYGINYVVKNPLNKMKRYFNNIASVLWFLSFFSPFYILIILFFNSVLANGLVLTIVSILFLASAIFSSIWSERKDRELDSMELDDEIEKLKLEPANKDNVAEFLREYMLLEFLVKNAIVENMNISIEEDESIDLSGATNILLDKQIIKFKTKDEIGKLWKLHDKIVHEEYKISEKEIEQIKDAIKKFDLDVKEYEGRKK
jgi:hypothetical protein